MWSSQVSGALPCSPVSDYGCRRESPSTPSFFQSRTFSATSSDASFSSTSFPYSLSSIGSIGSRDFEGLPFVTSLSTIIDRPQTILKSSTYCTFIYATGSGNVWRYNRIHKYNSPCNGPFSFYYISTFHLVFLPCIKGGSIPPLSPVLHICTTRTKSRFAPPLFLFGIVFDLRFVSLCAMKVGIINCCNVSHIDYRGLNYHLFPLQAFCPGTLSLLYI